MANKQIQMAFIRTDKWEGTKLENGRIVRAFVDTDLQEMIDTGMKGIIPIMEEFPKGTRVTVVVEVQEPEVSPEKIIRSNDRSKIKREK